MFSIATKWVGSTDMCKTSQFIGHDLDNTAGSVLIYAEKNKKLLVSEFFCIL
jgi:hypothetical protein